MDIQKQRKETRPHLLLLSHIHLKCIKDLNLRPEAIKLQEDNMGEGHSLPLVLEMILLIQHPKTNNKSKEK